MIFKDRIEKLQDFNWPEIQEIDYSIINSGDIFICCEGFEERAFSILSNIIRKGISPKIISIKYEPKTDKNKDILEVFPELKIVKNITYYRFNCEDFTMEFENLIDKLLGSVKQKIFVDISSMSKLLIIQIIFSFRKIFKNIDNIYIFYSEAETYYPLCQNFQNNLEKISDSYFFLTTGIENIIILSELSSNSMQGEPKKIIVFPSFNPQQLSSILNELQPSSIEIINGIPYRKKDRWRTEAIYSLNQEVLNRFNNKNINHHNISTFFYKETIKLTLQIIENSKYRYRLFISPTGSKMQAVAIGILKIWLNNYFQILYPPSREYQYNHYTKGVKNSYMLPIELHRIHSYLNNNSDE